MKTHIVHQAGSRFDELAQRIETLVAKAAPLVEEVTQLRLPDALVIRTMTWRKRRRVMSRHARQVLRAEAYELRPPLSSIRAAKGDMRAARAAMRTHWMGMGAETVDLRGRAEILLLPQALREAGRLHDDDSLLQVFAHELTHVAQWKYAGEDAWRRALTLFPAERGITDRDYSFLFEGHAYWTDAQVTAKILGAPVPIAEISPHSTLRYRAMAEAPEAEAAVRHIRTARDSVSAAISAHGLDLINDALRDPKLVPLRSETSTPEAWSARLTDKRAEQSRR
ncbi:hypothetical protein [Streptomyces sp. MMBL 11-1]|uniref:hypothetical protein n=1 Tax=Streptomyces sp. MMBL 11-1 TaxID=3026420 RepID=UPI00235E4DDD|nr:hypothetical protein [Streptomyces sp. MMBL 11-1]